MKISVLIPSEEFKQYAGARIRYGRLKPHLSQLGIDIALANVAEFAPDKAECDVLIISKCHDARALIAAAASLERGILVGVDLFDDYFSQTSDSRLARYRIWLSQILPSCDFALCSTPAMAQTVEDYRADLPWHVVNDPADGDTPNDLSRVLAAKLAKAKDDQMLRLAWFGVGDNPHFDVGLSDVAAYSGILSRLRHSGMDVELTVLTNSRALSPRGLAMLGEVPVRTRLLEWSEERERRLLRDAFACFIPVNAQGFSAAKSLNRAVTALVAGCQVISVGYPLYARLGQRIYRDVESFLEDLASGRMRHAPNSIEQFERAVDDLASAKAEAAGLATFLTSRKARKAGGAATLALVHGFAINGPAHKLVQSLGGLSVASPYCTGDLAFDVIFQKEAGGFGMLVSDDALPRLVPGASRKVRENTSVPGRRFWKIPGGLDPQTGAGGAADRDVPVSLATYATSMKSIGVHMSDAFGPCRLFLSETSGLPLAGLDSRLALF
ncbi:MAG TPA: hypothetical protein VFH89_14880 [Sphingomicrobium sp.]|nr:hypothetical protein [Sphingomicrobium sp.]